MTASLLIPCKKKTQCTRTDDKRKQGELSPKKNSANQENPNKNSYQNSADQTLQENFLRLVLYWTVFFGRPTL